MITLCCLHTQMISVNLHDAFYRLAPKTLSLVLFPNFSSQQEIENALDKSHVTRKERRFAKFLVTFSYMSPSKSCRRPFTFIHAFL